MTQRLIAEPSVEVNVAIQSVPEFGVGSGFNDLELALRLRYEVARELAPHVGVSWRYAFGETGDLLRADGEDVSDLQVVVGVRAWF